MGAIEIQENLFADDVCDTAGIILLILHQANIALLQVRHIIKNDELYFIIKGGFQF